MKFLRPVAVLAILSTFTPICSMESLHAQEQRRHFTSHGNVEVGGSVTYQAVWVVLNDKTSSSSTFVFTAMPFAGYFLLDGVELGVNPAGVVLSGGTGKPTVTQLRILLAPSYNFRTSTIATPFVEGLAGFTTQTTENTGTGTTTLSGFTWGGRAGLKVGLTEHGLLTIGVQYLQVTLNPSGSSKRNGFNELSASAGWTVWF